MEVSHLEPIGLILDADVIIDQETYDKAAAIRFERAGKLGRLNRKKSVKPAASPTGFRMAAAEQNYEDPRLQAEYLYSLIESEVS